MESGRGHSERRRIASLILKDCQEFVKCFKVHVASLNFEMLLGGKLNSVSCTNCCMQSVSTSFFLYKSLIRFHCFRLSI